jgi:sulfotransferase
MLGAISRKNEAAVFISEEQKRELLCGVFRNYYHSVEAAKVIFDTNRLWCTKLPGLVEHFPHSKVICCVRSVSWIMDSIERLIRRNTYELSGIFGYDAGGTVYTRVNRLAANDGMVGSALDALREAFYSEHASRLMLVTYQALAREPHSTMAQIMISSAKNGSNTISTMSNMMPTSLTCRIGTPGLHTVRRKVEFVERPTILPPELFARFENDAF